MTASDDPQPAAGAVGAFVARTAARFPDKAAVVQGGETLSYGALDRAANRLAHRLLEAGAKGDRVAHLLPDGVGVFVALLAALKAGRINHVLNHRDPLPRLEELVADSAPEAIVTASPHADLAARLAGGRARIIRIDLPVEGVPESEPTVAIGARDGAYLVYTSGSTGRPKAVLLAHGDLVRMGLGLRERMSFAAHDRVVLLSALWGNQALGTTFATLLSGATLVPFPVVDYGVAGLASLLADQRITVYASASSLLRTLVATLDPDARFPSIRIAKLSADPATTDDLAAFRRHFPNADLFSGMGASEIGTIAGMILGRADLPAPGPLPVGTAMPGLTLRVVDEEGRDVAPGETGRLLIRSPALFGRYWQDDALTETRWQDLDGGLREFRSEDSVRLDQAGNLLHAGRRDATYKIRGLRVDLAEVERLLRELPGVIEAGAAVVGGPDGGDRLVAHVVVRGEASEQRLRALARAHMPRHMVPSILVLAASLPRAANGKVDRVRLASSATVPNRRGPPPATDTERELALWWEEALERDAVSREDDFFSLGGDSLSAATVAIRIEAARGIRLPFSAFVETPVLADMARAIDDGRFVPEEADRLAPVPRGAEAPTSLLQEPFWRASRAPSHAWRYTRAAALVLDGPLDRAALETALGSVLKRHEILRTRYRAGPDAVFQVVEPPAPVSLPFLDLAGNPEAEAEVDRLLAEEGIRAFDLKAAPPLALRLLRLSAQRHVLLRSAHHILDDAPSWNIFKRDLGAFYAAAIEGGQPGLPELPIQYADFSIWQRRAWRPGGPRHRRAVAWLSAKLAASPVPPTLRTMPGYLRRLPAGEGPARGTLRWGVDAATAGGLERLAGAEAATFYAVRLACLSVVASRMTRHCTVVIGGVFTNRTVAAVEHMIGPMANIVPLVIRCSPEATFRDHVRRVMAEVVEAHHYADTPLALMQAALADRGVEMPPPFLWIHVPTSAPQVIAGGLSIRQRTASYVGASGIVMVRFNPLDEAGGSTISIDPRLYRPELLDDLAAQLRSVAAAAAATPDMTLAALAAVAERVAPAPGSGSGGPTPPPGAPPPTA